VFVFNFFSKFLDQFSSIGEFSLGFLFGNSIGDVGGLFPNAYALSQWATSMSHIVCDDTSFLSALIRGEEGLRGGKVMSGRK